MATGIQDKFSWKGVALAGIGAGVGAALGGMYAFGKLAEGASQGSSGSGIAYMRTDGLRIARA